MTILEEVTVLKNIIIIIIFIIIQVYQTFSLLIGVILATTVPLQTKLK